MRIPHLFLDPGTLAADPVCIEGLAHHHLSNVLRVRCGDRLVLLDNRGGAWHACVESVEKRRTIARIEAEAPCAPDPPIHITVAQALSKGDKFEQVVQHGTEIGASAFIPLLTERTAYRMEARTAADKLARWQQIAQSAAEQCCRPRIPDVHPPERFQGLVDRAAEYECAILLHPHGLPPTRESAPSQVRVLLLIGPEGGFSDCEVAQAVDRGVRVLSLGPYILRTETAALVALSQMLYGWQQGGG